MDRYSVYGACSPETDEALAAAREQPPAPAAPVPATGPIFLENPDGTITEAVPFNYKDPRAKTGRAGRGGSTAGREGDSDGSSGASDAAANMYQEVDFLYIRHQRSFLLLICTEALLDILYGTVSFIRMQTSVVEVVSMYNWQVSPETAYLLLWFVFVLLGVYSIAYYVFAGIAMWTKLPKHYQNFATWCLVGIGALLLLAFVDKFNLPIFFLRLIAYVYARFLQCLTSNLMLLPPQQTPASAVP